jgi:hypothetical protein
MNQRKPVTLFDIGTTYREALEAVSELDALVLPRHSKRLLEREPKLPPGLSAKERARRAAQSKRDQRDASNMRRDAPPGVMLK